MKEKKRILSAYKRKVHIDGQEWTYQIGETPFNGLVKVCSPNQMKKWILKVGLLENPYSDRRYCWNPITPAHIKRLIEKRILGKERKELS